MTISKSWKNDWDTEFPNGVHQIESIRIWNDPEQGWQCAVVLQSYRNAADLASKARHKISKLNIPIGSITGILQFRNNVEAAVAALLP